LNFAKQGIKLKEGMRMRVDTVETKVYKFEELGEDAKQTAMEEMWDINVDYDWWDSVFEDAERIGLELKSFDLDRNRHAEGLMQESASNVAENITKEHGEQCDTYKLAIGFLSDKKALNLSYEDEEDSRELEELEEVFEKNLLEEYACLLQREHDYRTEEESIVETIIANKYEFTEGGKFYY
jgi:hypothetical protein